MNDKIVYDITNFKSISGKYLSIYLCNLKNNTYKELYAKENIHEILGTNGDLDASTDEFVKSTLNSTLSKIKDLDINLISKSLKETGAYSIEYENDGNWHRLRFFPFTYSEEGIIEEFICTIQDISEEIKRQQMLDDMMYLNHKMKYIDSLTQVLNREGFMLRVEEILKLHKKNRFCLFYADISHLNYINSNFGEDIGDKLLITWCNEINSKLGQKELVGRISGDKFSILYCLDKKSKQDNIKKFLNELLVDVNNSFKEYLNGFKVNAYFGVYLINKNDINNMSIDKMISYSMHASKKAKENNNGIVSIYNTDDWKKREKNILIDQNLNQAIETGEIEAWLQPQYDYLNNRVIGAEVLCRWNSKTLGFISPADFIPVLEETGKIVVLDKYIWETTCKYMRKWLDNDMPFVPLSINVSRKDINQLNVVSVLNDLLLKYDLKPEMLSVEITENSYVDNKDKIISILKELQASGFKVEMDDFGSGYSSLNMLKEVPVDVLKMDLRFFSGNNIDKRGGSIISSVIRMAQGLNMSIIAEGVETKEQADLLKNMSCYNMQGFYFAKPMPIDEFENYLKNTKHEALITENTDTDVLKYIYEIIDSDTNSSYIFNNISGPSGIFEYSNNNLEVMWVNEAFLKTIKDDSGVFLSDVKNALASICDEDTPKARIAIKEAIEKGNSECEVYLDELNVWIKITFKNIYNTLSSNYFFSTVTNITEMHNASVTTNKFFEQVTKQIGMVPMGLLRYEASGEQKFSYISDGLLNLLNYSSVDEFKEKFNNQFPNMVYVEDRERVLKEIDDKIAETGCDDYCEYRVETGDGKLKRVYDIGKLVTDEFGKKWFYVAIADLEQIESMLDSKNELEKKVELSYLIPGYMGFEYNYNSNKITIFKYEDGIMNKKEYDNLIDDIYSKKYISKETYLKIIQIKEEAIKDIKSGSVVIDISLESYNRNKVCVNYSTVNNIRGEIVKIVGNLILN